MGTKINPKSIERIGKTANCAVFFKDMLHQASKNVESILGRYPVKRVYRDVIVFAKVNGKYRSFLFCGLSFAYF